MWDVPGYRVWCYIKVLVVPCCGSRVLQLSVMRNGPHPSVVGRWLKTPELSCGCTCAHIFMSCPCLPPHCPSLFNVTCFPHFNKFAVSSFSDQSRRIPYSRMCECHRPILHVVLGLLHVFGVGVREAGVVSSVLQDFLSYEHSAHSL